MLKARSERMKTFIKVLLTILGVFVLLIASIALYFSDYSEKRKIKKYAEDTYGYDVEIKQLYRTGIGSDYEYVVFPKNHQHLEFKITLDPYSDTITDNYASALEADKALHKLDKVIPAIEDLGFQGPDYTNKEISIRFSDETKKHALYLYTATPIEMATFEKNELDRFFELQNLIKQSGAPITYVVVEDMREPADSSSILFYMKDVQSTNTKDDFLLQLKKANHGLK